jgi:hypothetical protein
MPLTGKLAGRKNQWENPENFISFIWELPVAGINTRHIGYPYNKNTP